MNEQSEQAFKLCTEHRHCTLNIPLIKFFFHWKKVIGGIETVHRQPLIIGSEEKQSFFDGFLRKKNTLPYNQSQTSASNYAAPHQNPY